MIHYTLNSGHTRVSPRSEVGPGVVGQLLPLLAAGKHAMPGPPGYTLQSFREGGYFATIWRGDRPCISLAVAADESQADAIWPALEKHYLSITELRGIRSADFAAPRRPKSVPWCAACTILATPDEAEWMTDLERCLAWAWIENQ